MDAESIFFNVRQNQQVVNQNFQETQVEQLVNQYEAKWDKYTIISLGTNCFTRTLLTKSFIKPSKNQGEKSMPFDLVRSISCLDRTLDLLESDFNGYFDNLEELDVLSEENEYRCECTRFEHPEGKVMFANDYLESDYIHDGGLTRDEFIKRYTDRINNFREAIRSNKHIFFFVSKWDTERCLEQITRCCDILNNICKQAHSLIFYCPSTDVQYTSHDVLILNKDYDVEDRTKIWSSYMSEDGLPHFKHIIDEIKSFIDNRIREIDLNARVAKIDKTDKNYRKPKISFEILLDF